MKEKVHMDKVKHTRRVRLWFVLVILVLCGAAAWVLYDGGIIGGKNAPVAVESVSEQINENVVPESDAVKSDSAEIRPACAVVEDTLLTYITDDRDSEWQRQANSAEIYTVLSQRGCPENAQLFKDLAARKQAIADGLHAVYEDDNSEMTSIEYLY